MTDRIPRAIEGVITFDDNVYWESQKAAAAAPSAARPPSCPSASTLALHVALLNSPNSNINGLQIEIVPFVSCLAHSHCFCLLSFTFNGEVSRYLRFISDAKS
ncbi:unnamed protein product, partial [Brenthis ino]